MHNLHEKNMHLAWIKTAKKLVRDVRQRGIKDLEISFDEPTVEKRLETATLHTGTARYELSWNAIVGFTLLTTSGVEISICEERAGEELYYLLSSMQFTPLF